MKLLFIPDIVGRPGRNMIKKFLPLLIKERKPDFVVANAENLSHGNGFSLKNIEEMREVGINFFTSGNHAWDIRDGAGKLDDKNFPVIRPANYPEGVPGRGYEVIKNNKHKILIINLIGRVFMKKNYDCPFRVVDKILEETKKLKPDIIFVDFHAEATAEKMAMAFYLDGRVNALIGTHTHVATNDLRVLPKGTVYMTDGGMNGSYDSVIGIKYDLIIKSFLTQMPVKHEPEDTGKMIFNGIWIELDDKNLKALNIEHLTHSHVS